MQSRGDLFNMKAPEQGPCAPVASEVAVAIAGMIFPAMSFALSLSTSYSRKDTMLPVLLPVSGEARQHALDGEQHRCRRLLLSCISRGLPAESSCGRAYLPNPR